MLYHYTKNTFINNSIPISFNNSLKRSTDVMFGGKQVVNIEIK